ncbi:hypothetical protein AGMMS4957_07910 [Bacteroidia bacterium]|nr:hypothetical protein AGMMS4957_07910 [Bacteroidia bacterium]
MFDEGTLNAGGGEIDYATSFLPNFLNKTTSEAFCACYEVVLLRKLGKNEV